VILLTQFILGRNKNDLPKTILLTQAWQWSKTTSSTLTKRSKQMNTQQKFDPMEIEAILDKVVPLISSPEDDGFFRGVLTIKAQESSRAAFTVFINNLLKQHYSLKEA